MTEQWRDNPQSYLGAIFAPGVLYPAKGEAGDAAHAPVMAAALLRICDGIINATAAEVFKDGENPDLTIGVRPLSFFNGAALVNYIGASSFALTDDATNYVYLTVAGVLTKSTSSFPSELHIPLAEVKTGTASIAAASGGFAVEDITPRRDRAMFRPAGRSDTPRSVSQTLNFGDFTDNTDATGYIDFTTDDIPAGSVIVGWKAVVATGFTGDTTAVIEVGVSGDTDAWSADVAQSVLAAATVGSAPLAATAYVAAAATPRVTVTGGADFTSISAGEMVVTVYYLPLD